MIGYVRLALIPVFLVLAWSTDGGRRSGRGDRLRRRSPAATTSTASAARVTGQYSRMGALLDPVVDRLLVICGVVVCWHFDLLPRWLLAILVAREVLMLLARAARAAPRRRARRSTGRGGWGVWPIDGGAVLRAAAALRDLRRGAARDRRGAAARSRRSSTRRAARGAAGAGKRNLNLTLTLGGALVCSRRRGGSRADEENGHAMDDTFPDLGSLTDEELKDLIQQLTDEENEISYQRRILHGKIDILRAELVNRLRKKHEGGEDDHLRRRRPAADRHPRRQGRRRRPGGRRVGTRSRGAALPGVRLRQHRGRQLLPEVRCVPRRPRRSRRAESVDGDLPHRRGR